MEKRHLNRPENWIPRELFAAYVGPGSDDLLAYYRGTLLSKLETTTSGNNGGSIFSGNAAKSGMPMMVLEALLRLRQASCHPGLIDEKRNDQPSAKLEALLEHLAELIDEKIVLAGKDIVKKAEADAPVVRKRNGFLSGPLAILRIVALQ